MNALSKRGLKLGQIPDWLSLVGESDERVPLFVYGEVVRRSLEPLEDGAILHWTFTSPHEPLQLAVFVRLTDDEAQTISDIHEESIATPVLEPVRANLVNQVAILRSHKLSRGKHGIIPLTIPRSGSEEQFIEELYAAGEEAPRWWKSAVRQAEMSYNHGRLTVFRLQVQIKLLRLFGFGAATSISKLQSTQTNLSLVRNSSMLGGRTVS